MQTPREQLDELRAEVASLRDWVGKRSTALDAAERYTALSVLLGLLNVPLQAEREETAREVDWLVLDQIVMLADAACCTPCTADLNIRKLAREYRVACQYRTINGDDA